jgi:hypothetical protein
MELSNLRLAAARLVKARHHVLREAIERSYHLVMSKASKIRQQAYVRHSQRLDLPDTLRTLDLGRRK